MSEKQDLAVYLPKSDYEFLKEVCEETGLSIEQITSDAVDKYNDTQRPKIKASKSELNRIKHDLFR